MTYLFLCFYLVTALFGLSEPSFFEGAEQQRNRTDDVSNKYYVVDNYDNQQMGRACHIYLVPPRLHITAFEHAGIDI
jgi:hypothetical protein